MKVISTTAMVFKVLAGMGTPRPDSHSTRLSEKLSAAKALPRNPDRVMATWMVARNLAGRLVSLLSRLAFLLPWEAILASFASLMERTAISALAKTAFSAIKTTCISNRNPTESFNVIQPLS